MLYKGEAERALFAHEVFWAAPPPASSPAHFPFPLAAQERTLPSNNVLGSGRLRCRPTSLGLGVWVGVCMCVDQGEFFPPLDSPAHLSAFFPFPFTRPLPRSFRTDGRATQAYEGIGAHMPIFLFPRRKKTSVYLHCAYIVDCVRLKRKVFNCFEKLVLRGQPRYRNVHQLIFS